MRIHPAHARHLPYLLLVVGISLVVSSSPARAQVSSTVSTAAMSPDLDAARTALAKYSDPLAAVRDGYFSTLACMDFPTGMTDGTVEYPPGAMGVHFLNTANIGPSRSGLITSITRQCHPRWPRDKDR